MARPSSKPNPKRYMGGDFASFKAFCLDCVKITGGDDKKGHTKIIPFKMWPAQEELAAALCDPDVTEIIVDKPRQMGATWVILAWQLWRVLFVRGIEERITSVGEEEASKALIRVKFMLEHLPAWITPELTIDNTTTIKVGQTGSWLRALPATQHAGRGDTLNDILLDEAAHQIYCQQIVKSAAPSLEKRHGKMILVSTAAGTGNYFHKVFTDATAGKNGYRWFFFPWTADPGRTQAWYDKMLAKHGREHMLENYPRTWQESFLATGDTYFADDLIAADLELEDDPYRDGFVDGGKFHERPEGWVRVWCDPVPGRKYVMFADVAEGGDKGDFDNAYVLDAETLETMARVRGKMPVGEYADLLMAVGEWYGYGDGIERMPALLAIEANNHGIAITKHCADSGYRNLWMERNYVTGKFTGRVGWLTSQGQMGTRGLMLGRLQTLYAIRKLKVRDRTLLEEMAVFSRIGPRGKPQAPAGYKDDCVMSYAGAVTVATFESLPEVVEEVSEFAGARLAAVEDLKKLRVGAEEPLNQGLEELGG